MREVLEDVGRVRATAARLQADLAERFGVPEGDPPVGGLGICFNNTTLTLELLDHYSAIWSKVASVPPAELARSRQENAERVTLVSKALFVLSMSGFEFSAKAAMAVRPGKIVTPRGRIYLRDIMRASQDRGLIDSALGTLWEGAIRTRNNLVHNNGIAENNMTYAFPQVTVTMVQGRMMQGNLRFFALLTEWCVEAYARWCGAFLA